MHTRGLRFVADDLDWSRGDGPEVRGSAEAIVMAVAGRRAALGDLSGPGWTILAGRLGESHAAPDPERF